MLDLQLPDDRPHLIDPIHRRRTTRPDQTMRSNNKTRSNALEPHGHTTTSSNAALALAIDCDEMYVLCMYQAKGYARSSAAVHGSGSTPMALATALSRGVFTTINTAT